MTKKNQYRITNAEQKHKAKNTNNLTNRLNKNSLSIIMGILIIVPFLIYIQTGGYGFVWDDEPLYINTQHFPTQNVFKNYQKFWVPSKTSMYAPVTYSFWSFAASMGLNQKKAAETSGHELKSDGQTVIFDPGIFHILNLIIHILNVLLVFLILYQLFKKPWVALGGALIFSLHPVQVESVAWVSELRGLLCALFGFYFIWQYLLYRSEDSKIQGFKDSKIEDTGNSKIQRFKLSRVNKIYIKAILGLILSMLSKPTGVVFPFIVLIFELLYFKKSIKDILKTNILFFILIIPIVLISLMAESSGVTQFHAPLWARPMIFFDTINSYIFNLVFPINLAASYGRTPNYVINSPWLYLSWILPVVIILILWIKRKSANQYLIAFLIFIAGYLPVSGLIPFYYQYMSTTADRYLYIPMLGISFAFALAITKFKNTRAAAYFTSVIIIILSVLTINQLPVWKNEFNLWSNTIEKYPESSPHPYSGRGLIYLEQKKYQDAISDFNKAIELGPNEAMAYYNRGNAYYDTEIFDKAIDDFSTTIKINKKYVNAYVNRGLAFSDQNRNQEAIRDYTIALSYVPEQADVYVNRGICYAKMNEFEVAAWDFQKALLLNPDDKEAEQNLKMAKEEIKKKK